jgi:hypothetical protein
MVVFIRHACGGFMASKSHEGWIFYIGWKRCNFYLKFKNKNCNIDEVIFIWSKHAIYESLNGTTYDPFI